MVNFNSDHKKILDELFLGYPLVLPGKMFGYPAYFVGKKLCACLYEQGVGVKLPEELAIHLLETDGNITPFQPLGRHKMREWIQINLSRSEEYRRYQSVFEESIRFVAGQAAK